MKKIKGKKKILFFSIVSLLMVIFVSIYFTSFAFASSFTWKKIRTIKITGPIAFDPNDPETIYFATANDPYLISSTIPSANGLYKTTNRGKDWSQINDTFLTSDINIWAIEVDSADSNTIYLGTNVKGIFKSTNGGKNWRQKNSGIQEMTGTGLVGYIGPQRNITTLVQDKNTGSLYAGTAYSNCGADEDEINGGDKNSHLYKSVDGAETWAIMDSGITYRNISHMCATTVTDNLYASTVGPHPDPAFAGSKYRDETPKVYKTTNGGNKWFNTGNAGLIDRKLIDPTYPPTDPLYKASLAVANMLFLTVDPNNIDVLYTVLSAYDASKYIPPFHFFKENYIYKSTNGAKNWQRIKQGLYGYMGIDKINPNNLWICGRESSTANTKVFHSANSGSSWVEENTGLPTPNPTAAFVKPSPFNGNEIFGSVRKDPDNNPPPGTDDDGAYHAAPTDTTDPTGTINGPTTATSNLVTLSLNATDNKGVYDNWIRNDPADPTFPTISKWQVMTTYPTDNQWLLPPGSGNKTVKVNYRDLALNTSTTYTATINLNPLPDPATPNGSISINNGAPETQTREVTLSLTATDNQQVTGMMVSNDPSFAGGTWEIYETTKNWVLTPEIGTKTVYVKYMDPQGNISAAFSDSILYTVRQPPLLSINNGAKYTTNPNVTLSVTPRGGSPQTLIISNYSDYRQSVTMSYKSTIAWTLESSPEPLSKNVYVTSIYVTSPNFTGSAGINLDNYAPNGPLLINGGAKYVASTKVLLTYTIDENNKDISSGEGGVKGMMISNDSSFKGMTWQPFTTATAEHPKEWGLIPGYGTKTVYMKLKDYLQNTRVIPATVEYTNRTVGRVYGADRYATAVALSKANYTTSNTVVLCRGDLYPDALCGAPLAAKYSAPILLTYPNVLAGATADEIKRLKVSEVFILGSEDAVSSQVVSDLKSKCNIQEKNIHRVGGKDRYETSSLIAEQLTYSPETTNTAIMATGENFPDALASTAVAAATTNGVPILLVDKDTISAGVQNVLKDKNKNILNITIVGGEDVVGHGFTTWCSDNHFEPLRIGGMDRYETAEGIAGWGLTMRGMSPEKIYIATGLDFPDALASGPVAAKNNAPILLTVKDALRDYTQDFLLRWKPDIFRITISGGPDVISNDVKAIIADTIAAAVVD